MAIITASLDLRNVNFSFLLDSASEARRAEKWNESLRET